MFTYNEVLQALDASVWPESAKQILSPNIPRLGKWALSYLAQQLNTTGSEFAADDIAEIISLEPQWYQNLQDNQDATIISSTQKIIDSNDETNHKALLALILDIRTNKTIAGMVTTNISKIFDQVEVLYLRNLPVSELANILLIRINRIHEVADLQMEIKRYCYYRDSLSKDDSEIIAFKQALENNDQTIGAESKTIKSLINDFLQSAASSKDRSVYNVAHYMTNSATVKKFTESEKAILSEILKLYNWLFKPTTTEEEIEGYEEHRLIKQANPVKKAVVSDVERFEVEEPGGQKGPEKNPMNLTNSSDLDDMIKGVPKLRVGVVRDPTNIKLADETQRLVHETSQREKQIQYKLSELRKRNTKNEPNA